VPLRGAEAAASFGVMHISERDVVAMATTGRKRVWKSVLAIADRSRIVRSNTHHRRQLNSRSQSEFVRRPEGSDQEHSEDSSGHPFQIMYLAEWNVANLHHFNSQCLDKYERS